MKQYIAPTVIAGVAGIVVGLTAISVHRYQHRPEPELTISRASFDDYRSQVFYEQQQAETVHKQQMAAVIDQLTTATKQKTEVCAQLTKARLTNAACK